MGCIEIISLQLYGKYNIKALEYRVLEYIPMYRENMVFYDILIVISRKLLEKW